MIRIIPAPIRGTLSLGGYAANTIFWTIPLFAMAGAKAISPAPAWRRFCNWAADGLASNWVWVNQLNMALTSRTKWDIKGLEGLDRDKWYLVLANHQSWVDILVLQKIFYRKIPFLKFFLKQQLIWFPILGQAWWALDMPFMKRVSKKQLKKNPKLRGYDMRKTIKACEKFKSIPVSVMNFVEGTRFTEEKHQRQNSPYRHLLTPNAGGIAMSLATMGDQMDRILNVTISYPKGVQGFWGFLCGKIEEIRVRVEQMPVKPELRGDYFHDRNFRKGFQSWLNNVWIDKDNCMECLAQTRNCP